MYGGGASGRASDRNHHGYGRHGDRRCSQLCESSNCRYSPMRDSVDSDTAALRMPPISGDFGDERRCPRHHDARHEDVADIEDEDGSACLLVGVMRLRINKNRSAYDNLYTPVHTHTRTEVIYTILYSLLSVTELSWSPLHTSGTVCQILSLPHLL